MIHTENMHVELNTNTMIKNFQVSVLSVDKVLMREKDNPQEFGREIQYGFFASYNQNLYSFL